MGPLVRPTSWALSSGLQLKIVVDIPNRMCIILIMDIVGGLLSIWLLVVLVKIVRDDAKFYSTLYSEDLTNKN